MQFEISLFYDKLGFLLRAGLCKKLLKIDYDVNYTLIVQKIVVYWYVFTVWPYLV